MAHRKEAATYGTRSGTLFLRVAEARQVRSIAFFASGWGVCVRADVALPMQLLAKDEGGVSDPFCTVELLDVAMKQRGDTGYASRIVVGSSPTHFALATPRLCRAPSRPSGTKICRCVGRARRRCVSRQRGGVGRAVQHRSRHDARALRGARQGQDDERISRPAQDSDRLDRRPERSGTTVCQPGRLVRARALCVRSSPSADVSAAGTSSASASISSTSRRRARSVSRWRLSKARPKSRPRRQCGSFCFLVALVVFDAIVSKCRKPAAEQKKLLAVRFLFSAACWCCSLSTLTQAYAERHSAEAAAGAAVKPVMGCVVDDAACLLVRQR